MKKRGGPDHGSPGIKQPAERGLWRRNAEVGARRARGRVLKRRRRSAVSASGRSANRFGCGRGRHGRVRAHAAGRRSLGEGARAPAAAGNRPVGRRGAPAAGAGVPLRTADGWSTCPAGVRWGWIPETGELVLVSEVQVGRQPLRPRRGGRALPPGCTRTFLPGEVKARRPGATAVGVHRGRLERSEGPVAWALRTDRRRTGTRSGSRPRS